MDKTLFSTLSQACIALAVWRADYNGSRPHSKLGWQTPLAFAATFQPRQDLTLRYDRGAAPDLAAHPANDAKSNRKNELTIG